MGSHTLSGSQKVGSQQGEGDNRSRVNRWEASSQTDKCHNGRTDFFFKYKTARSASTLAIFSLIISIIILYIGLRDPPEADPNADRRSSPSKHPRFPCLHHPPCHSRLSCFRAGQPRPGEIPRETHVPFRHPPFCHLSRRLLSCVLLLIGPRCSPVIGSRLLCPSIPHPHDARSITVGSYLCIVVAPGPLSLFPLSLVIFVAFRGPLASSDSKPSHVGST